MKKCAASTKKGRKCKNNVSSDSRYCHLHKQKNLAKGTSNDLIIELFEHGAKKLIDRGIDALFDHFLPAPRPEEHYIDVIDAVVEEDKLGLLNVPQSSLPVSSRSFAKELVNSGKRFAVVVEANNPLNKELTEDDIEDFAQAVSDEVAKKLAVDPQFRSFLKQELTDLRKTLPSNLLANAVVQGITLGIISAF